MTGDGIVAVCKTIVCNTDGSSPLVHMILESMDNGVQQSTKLPVPDTAEQVRLLYFPVSTKNNGRNIHGQQLQNKKLPDLIL
jgi:hypothetical protein